MCPRYVFLKRLQSAFDDEGGLRDDRPARRTPPLLAADHRPIRHHCAAVLAPLCPADPTRDRSPRGCQVLGGPSRYPRPTAAIPEWGAALLPLRISATGRPASGRHSRLAWTAEGSLAGATAAEPLPQQL